MNAPVQHSGRSADATRLRAVRDGLAAIAPAKWTRVHGADGAFLESRGEMGELFVLARFDEATVDEIAFLCDAADHVAFLLQLLDKAFFEIRALRGISERNKPAETRGPPAASSAKNYSAECAMRCQDPAFAVFLEQCHRLERPLTPERVAQKVRSLLGVQSRKELNNGGRASEAWKMLRDSYAAWKRAGR